MGFLSTEPSQNALDRSKTWENGSFYGLAGAYAFIAFVAIVQLCRIQMRVPEYGWTTQKVFHLLNFVVMGVRAVVFFLRREVQSLRPLILQAVVLDLPGLLFFSTYSLLVLFWAEIYHQARSISTDRLRPAFLIVNSIVYLIQIIIWLFYWRSPTALVGKISDFFFAGVSLLAAMGFILYGGRLFLMLRRFPIESKGRQKKLWEVGCVTAICFACFAIRSFFLAFSAVDKKAELDVLYHPLLNVIYYLVVEILPSALVLFILRKLPPKRTNQYHPIPLA